ncbi:hypothetical protein LOTGIDRAFT_211287 [Lottia gigantea]|uniref:4-hydroxy-2-oxoglutarate aldolase, mitochondrial n=1 Tax=Lottia gigantea TaxID=225164 RepID=V3ZJR7_LOTGI|nr:hypothetical protein LOTGIDRAFT_211287 [Lottia gigantea]ESO82620.1 hypothetical protein LOTGIDRAFT_211287 [Lottia gigantea]
MNCLLRNLQKDCAKLLRNVASCRHKSDNTAGGVGVSELDISGIYPPIPTPFHPDESIAYDQLENNFNIWNKIPLKGYVVEGSNGEYTYLSPDERVEVVSKAVKLADKDKLIIAGSGCESTRDTIEMTRKMADAGADAVLVVTPCYFKGRMTNESLIQHYTRVADTSSIPVILYSVPANTGIDLSPEVIVHLAPHPNIIGMKDSAGDITKLASLVFKTKNKNFQVLAGSAGFLLPAYTVGCVGGVCALANILGKELCQLVDLFHAGRYQEALDLQYRCIAPNSAITKQYGVAGLKKAMEWFGYYGGPTRSPLLPVSQAEEKVIRNSFTQNNFLKN